jgi:anti-anti-sigma factor
MNEGRVLHARQGRNCIIKMIGEVRHTVSAGLDAVIMEALQGGDVVTFIIDLTETEFIDSTNLGLLAKIARVQWEKGREQSVIASTNPEVTTVLSSMGFDEAFVIVREPEAQGGTLEEAPAADEDTRRKARLILDAHEALMGMNDKNREMFHNVVELLRKGVASAG